MNLLPLPRSKVQLGEPLPWNVRDQETHVLLTKGHVVEDERQLDALLLRGAFVDVEEIKAANLQVAAAQKAQALRATSLFDMWDHTTSDLYTLLSKPPKGDDWLQRVGSFATALLALVDQDVDVALYRMVRQEQLKPFYFGYNHAIHSAVLGLLMARHVGWELERTLSLVQAALTMNMPIFALQGKMAEQDDPIKESQRVLIRKHPQDAFDWLTVAGVTDPQWLQAVAQHHERSNGTGYPQGISEVAEIAVALRLVDVFASKISPRLVRTAMPVKEAQRQLFAEHQGGAMAGALMKELGIYPPGELVQLVTGEVALVTRRGKSAKTPLVAVISSPSATPIVKTIHRDTAQTPYAIAAIYPNKAMVARMPAERVYGYSNAKV